MKYSNAEGHEAMAPPIVEDRHPGEPTWLWKLGNWTAISPNLIKSVGIAWLFKENGRWVFKPRITKNVALFYNAVFFLRICWPLGIFWTIRWAADGARAYWQAGVGWKLNGRLTVTFRIQGDVAATAGVTGPNFGQVQGFNYGTH